jgi:hypothetical protein
MRGHFAQHEHAVASAQRAHPESIEHALVRKTPVAPCQKAREIRLEVVGAEAIAAEHRVAAQQDPAVPEFWLLGLLTREMRIDIGTALKRERPRPRAAFQIEPRDAMNGERHRRYFALIPVVLLACSTNLLV